MIKIPGQPTSAATREQVKREHGGTALLAFSTGKDSICAWLACREQFEIVPFYCYAVPGLGFVEESLAYFETFFGQRILRYPHPSLYRKWANCVFQPPERWQTINAARLPMFDYDDVSRGVTMDTGKEGLTANGTRAADSLIRRIHFRRRGPINLAKRKFYPVWDWQIADCVTAMRRAGVKLPVDYWLFGRSFDGLDYRFLAPIKKHFPRDYARILECFPLADLELFRKEIST